MNGVSSISTPNERTGKKEVVSQLPPPPRELITCSRSNFTNNTVQSSFLKIPLDNEKIPSQSSFLNTSLDNEKKPSNTENSNESLLVTPTDPPLITKPQSTPNTREKILLTATLSPIVSEGSPISFRTSSPPVSEKTSTSEESYFLLDTERRENSTVPKTPPRTPLVVPPPKLDVDEAVLLKKYTEQEGLTKTNEQKTPSRSSTLRLVQKLVHVTEEKTASVKRATLLEQKLFELQHEKQKKNCSQSSLRTGAILMLSITLENRLKRKKLLDAFRTWKAASSPTISYPMTPPPVPSSTRNFQSPSFLATPRSTSQPTPSSKYLTEALNAVSLEYSSDVATYNIRCPYLLSDDDQGILPSKAYNQNANVSDPSTIEVLSKVHADDSTLILFDQFSIQHSSPSLGSRTWNNASKQKRELGRILYIDRHGMEQEYVLEDVFHEAILTREKYCQSLLTAANALQIASASKSKHSFENNALLKPPKLCDAAVQTIEFETPKPNQNNQKQTPTSDSTSSIAFQEQCTDNMFGKPTSLVDFYISSFIIITFKGFLFFLKVNLWVLPTFIFRFVNFSSVVICIMASIFYYFMDDHNASLMVINYFTEHDSVKLYSKFWEIARA